ncbi:FixH family protein [Dyadobacter luticola]|uniref:Nitrogen fixation protein FixH n=1 Tax=Dyadobacter luticola TaxID=1979387 RepID=A0A5R9L450_9BACT|nr:FixH family protein [Dyadobacter luticola]TLV03346.1 hypothetical protein FEN17_06970 [Dyadobacter luticola]
MKFNWGTGITALYLGFVAMILMLVTMSVGQKIDLVTEHYYDEELRFQDKIDKIERTRALAEPLAWKVEEGGIYITFPANIDPKTLSGEIGFYCPADDKNDRKFDVQPGEHAQFIPAASIPEGTYHLQIDWKSGAQTFWNEGVVTIKHSK